MADAAYEVLSKNAAEYSGQFLLDEEVLAEAGITDLSKYAFVPGNTKFYPDLFL
jgi:citronellol/citronellal dehydrogenase